jgi:hypothetical protein
MLDDLKSFVHRHLTTPWALERLKSLKKDSPKESAYYSLLSLSTDKDILAAVCFNSYKKDYIFFLRQGWSRHKCKKLSGLTLQKETLLFFDAEVAKEELLSL